MKWRNTLAIILLVLGFALMADYLLDSKVLRGIGAAGVFAPFPKVFCEKEGYEAFAASFLLEARDEAGQPWSLALTPEVYSQLSGCYNRRNVYGAALAFAPRLPEKLRDGLLAYSLAEDSALRRELGIPAGLSDVKIRITPRPGEANAPWVYQPEVTP